MQKPSKGLLILMEPDQSVMEALCTLLGGEGWEVARLNSAAELEKTFASTRPAAVISETRLPDQEAGNILTVCKKNDVPLIFTSHEQAVQQAVDLVQQGACGYFEKPFSQSRLLCLLDRLPERHNKKAT